MLQLFFLPEARATAPTNRLFGYILSYGTVLSCRYEKKKKTLQRLFLLSFWFKRPPNPLFSSFIRKFASKSSKALNINNIYLAL